MRRFTIITLILLWSFNLAHAQIKYTPYPSRAAALPGTLYLLLEESDNLVGVNPGAEEGDLTGWIGPNTTAINTDQYGGSYCFEITTSYLKTDGQPFDLVRGMRYKIIFAAKAIGGSDAISYGIYDENLIYVTPAQTQNITTSWKVYCYSFTASQNYYNCQFVYFSGTRTSHLDSILIAPEYLDMGLDSFSIDLLHQPLTQTGFRTLAFKRSGGSPAAGFHLYYDGNNYTYGMQISDGTNSVTTASAAVTQVQNQEYHWLRVTVDRTADLVKIYVNGVQSGSNGDISTVTGNISSMAELRLFGYDSVTYLAKTNCDFIRFQRGTLLDATWMAEEWARIQAGRIRGIPSATTLWDFTDDLVDGCQGLILAENTGTVTYTEGWPYCAAPVTYTFSVNYRHEYRITPLASDSLVRAFRTGAAYNLAGPRKNSYELPFVGITQAQYSAFLAAYEGGEIMDLWLDSAKEQTAKVYFSQPPEMNGIPYFRSGELVVNTTLYLVDS